MSSLRRITRTQRLRRTHVCAARVELEEEDDDDDVELLLRGPPETCPLRPIVTAPFPFNRRSNCGGFSASH